MLHGGPQENDGEMHLASALHLSSDGVPDAVAVRIVTGELRQEQGFRQPIEAVCPLGGIIHDEAEAGAAVEEATKPNQSVFEARGWFRLLRRASPRKSVPARLSRMDYRAG